MNLKEKLAEAPKVVEKKSDSNVWKTKKAEEEKKGNTYAPIFLPSTVVDTAKAIAKRLRLRYEEVLAEVLTNEDNYKVFMAEMKKAK